jgi:hypothetical protein
MRTHNGAHQLAQTGAMHSRNKHLLGPIDEYQAAFQCALALFALVGIHAIPLVDGNY